MLKHPPEGPSLDRLLAFLQGKGVTAHPVTGQARSVLVLSGDTARLDPGAIAAFDVVGEVKRISEPYRLAGRRTRPEDTVISVGNAQIGGGHLTVIAGPCAVESEEQLLAVARAVKGSGATLLRGGAFKPRSSPYAFQGLGEEALRLLAEAKRETGLPVVSEIMEASQLPLFDGVDVLQVGARNMQNFHLLRALGEQEKPVLLKRNPAATYEEWLLSAEYLMAAGNGKVILCERGVRGPEGRPVMDVAAASALKALSHLPVLLDPSHGAGRRELVPPLALAAVAAGADGLLIEVHKDPERALCDGQQSLRTEDFDRLVGKLFALRDLLNAPEAAGDDW